MTHQASWIGYLTDVYLINFPVLWQLLMKCVISKDSTICLNLQFKGNYNATMIVRDDDSEYVGTEDID